MFWMITYIQARRGVRATTMPHHTTPHLPTTRYTTANLLCRDGELALTLVVVEDNACALPYSVVRDTLQRPIYLPHLQTDVDCSLF